MFMPHEVTYNGRRALAVIQEDTAWVLDKDWETVPTSGLGHPVPLAPVEETYSPSYYQNYTFEVNGRSVIGQRRQNMMLWVSAADLTPAITLVAGLDGPFRLLAPDLGEEHHEDLAETREDLDAARAELDASRAELARYRSVAAQRISELSAELRRVRGGVFPG